MIIKAHATDNGDANMHYPPSLMDNGFVVVETVGEKNLVPFHVPPAPEPAHYRLFTKFWLEILTRTELQI